MDSIVEQVNRNAKSEQDARNMFAVLGMNRNMRRKIARVNGTAKIPGVNKPFVKPRIDNNH